MFDTIENQDHSTFGTSHVQKFTRDGNIKRVAATEEEENKEDTENLKHHVPCMMYHKDMDDV